MLSARLINADSNQFASRAKNIQNKAHVNEVMSDAALMKKYRRQINLLTTRLNEQINSTDTHTEKAELEKKLKEKEEMEHRQMDMIAKLQSMIVTSGSAVNSDVQEPPKKKRRETWCPGKAQHLLRRILDVSPSRIPKRVKKSVAFREEVDDSFQLLENIEMPAHLVNKDSVFEVDHAADGDLDETIHTNPSVKELFELQDKHEALLKESEEKDSKLAELQEQNELQEFTAFERDETIQELKQKIETSDNNFANVIWLEEELMKAQQERNGLRSEVESLKRKLSAVEDGTGLSQKSKLLSESEDKVVSLNSDMDIQKAKYEFHIEQMKSRLESYTQLLEDKGVDSDAIKQKVSSDISEGDDESETKISSQHTIDDLRNEVDSYVQQFEREKVKNAELVERHERHFEHQKQQFLNDIKEAREESDIYRQLCEDLQKNTKSETVEENTSESSPVNINECVMAEPVQVVSAEIENKKLLHEKQINEFKLEVSVLQEKLESQASEHRERLNIGISEVQDLEKTKPENSSHDKNENSNHKVEILSSEFLLKESRYMQEISDLKSRLEQITESFNMYKLSVDDQVTAGKEVDVKNETITVGSTKHSSEGLQEVHENGDLSNEAKSDSIEMDPQDGKNTDDDIVTAEPLLESSANIHVNGGENHCTKMLVRELQLEKDKYEVQIADLRGRLQHATEVIAELKVGIPSENMINDNAEIDEIQGLKTALQSEKAKSDEEIATLKAELNTLKCGVELGGADVRSEYNLEIELLRREMESEASSHEEEIAMFKGELEQVNELVNKYKSSIERMKSEMAYEKVIGEEEINSLKSELESMSTFVKEQTAKSVILPQENNSLQIDLQAKMESEKAVYEEQISVIKIELENIKQQLLHEQKSAHQDDNAPQDNADSLQLELLKSELESEKVESEKEIGNLKIKLEAITNSFDEYKANHSVENLLQNNGDSLQIEVLKAEMEHTKAKSDEEIETLKLKLDQMTNLFDEYKSASGNQNLSQDSLQMELLKAKMESEKDEEIATLNIELEQLGNLFDEYKSAPNDETSLQVELLKADMEFQKDKSDEEIATLTAKLNRVTEVYKEHRSACNDVNFTPDNGNTLQIELLKAEMESVKAKSEEEITRLNVELEHYSQLSNKYEIELESKQQGYDRYETELLKSDVPSEKEKSEQELTTLKTELEHVTGLLNEFKSACKDGTLPLANRNMISVDLLKAEMESQKARSDEDIASLQIMLEHVTGLFNEHKSAIQDGSIPKGNEDSLEIELLKAKIEMEKCKYEEKINSLSAELVLTTELMNELKCNEKNDCMSLDNDSSLKVEMTTSDSSVHTDILRSEINTAKAKYEEEVCALRKELEIYIQRESTPSTVESELEQCRSRLDDALEKNNQLELVHEKERKKFTEHQALYETTIQEIQEELHVVREDMQKVSMEIERLQSLNQTLKREKVALINEKETVADMVEQLRGRVKELEEASVAQVVEGADEHDENSKYEERLEQLKDELAAMKDRLAAKEMAEQQQRDLKHLEQESVMLDTIDRMKSEYAENMCSMVAEKEKLETDLEALNQAKFELENKLFDVKQEMVCVEENVDKLKMEHSENMLIVLAEKAKFETDFDIAVNARLELEQRLSEVTKDNETLEKDMSAVIAEKGSIEKDLNEFEEKLSQMITEKSVLGEDAAKLVMEYEERMEQVEAEKAQLHNELTAINEVKLELDTQLSEIITERAASEEDADKLRKELEERMEQVEEENTRLQIELTAVKESEQNSEAKLAQMIGERSTLEEEAEKFRMEYNQRIEQLDRERTLVQDELIAANKRKLELEDKLAQMISDRSAVGDDAEKHRIEYEERIKLAESEKTCLHDELEAVKAKFSEMDKVCRKLEEEKASLEADVYLLENTNMPRYSMKYQSLGANVEWETKWEEYVREEKKKRVVLISQMRTLKHTIEVERRKHANAVEEAVENVDKEVRATETYQRLQADWRTADDDANRLHSELREEKEVVKQLRDNMAQLEDQLKTKPVDTNMFGKEHSCQYRLDHFSVERQLKEAQEENLKRVSQYEETIQNYQERVTRLKNEMRRMQTLDTSIDLRRPQFKTPTPISTPDKPTPSNTSEIAAPFSGSLNAGIVDHYKVVFIEGENQRLKKMVDRHTAKLAKVEKENRGLREELSSYKSKKLKEDDTDVTEPSQSTSSAHPLTDVNKAGISIGPEVAASSVSKEPRFHIPDLKPKKADKQLIVGGVNMQEEANNCKSQ